jgi:hypothetical protein
MTRDPCTDSTNVVGLIAALALFLLVPPIHAEETPPINEGQLHFLDKPPPGSVPLHRKRVLIDRDALKTGWVRTEQCHFNLDPVPALQVVFGHGRVRDLTITRSEHIARAWIEGDTVQLEDVGRESILCLRSENRMLVRNTPTDYTLLSGPFMRRFLDGYFPMQVHLEVDYPPDLFMLDQVSPRGVRVSNPGSGRVDIDALFEGRLTVALHFSPTKASARRTRLVRARRPLHNNSAR